MRTTVTLDTEAYQLARAIAHQRNQTIGQVLGDALKQTLRPKSGSEKIYSYDASGWPQIDLGRTFTTEDVRAAIEED